MEEEEGKEVHLTEGKLKLGGIAVERRSSTTDVHRSSTGNIVQRSIARVV